MSRIEELSRAKTFYLRRIFPPMSDCQLLRPPFFSLRALGFGQHAAPSITTFFACNYYFFHFLTSEKQYIQQEQLFPVSFF